LVEALTLQGDCREILADLPDASVDAFVTDPPYGLSFMGSAGRQSPRSGAGRNSKRRNRHPTVKPIELMRWLVRLVTPPGGLVVDPFMGSGSTGCAAVLEGFDFAGFDLDPEHVRVAQARIEHWRNA